MPVTTPVTTPTIAPTTSPTPYWEEHTMPERICPQQTREVASPDVMP